MTWVAVAAIAAVASTGLAAVSAVNQGNAAQASANYQAQVARQNAVMAQENAANALKAGESKEQASRMKTVERIGEQKAIQGGSGLDVNSGSNMEVRDSTRILGEWDALTIRNSAAREAYGYETKSNSYNAQADVDVAEGENASKAGYLNATSSLLSGASQGAQQFGFAGGSRTLSTNVGDSIPWSPGNTFK